MAFWYYTMPLNCIRSYEVAFCFNTLYTLYHLRSEFKYGFRFIYGFLNIGEVSILTVKPSVLPIKIYEPYTRDNVTK